jgi:colanic acid/amylovoran biosynthesis glycosyltransferase
VNSSFLNPELVVVHSVPHWLHITENWLFTQVRFLPPEIQCHVVTEKTANLEVYGIRHLHSLSSSSWRQQFWDRGLRKLGIRRYLGILTRVARESHARVLHSHFGNVGWANLGAAAQARLKHLVTFYGLDVNYFQQADRRWRDRYGELFSQVQLVLCEGAHMAGCLQKLGCPASLVRVHHLGVDLATIPFKPRVWTSGPLRILVAATFKEKKGICYALEALGQLRRELALEITLIGDATREVRSQMEKERIFATIKRCGLESQMIWLGYQSHTRFLAESLRHHLFLSPSVTANDGDTEGGAPVSLIELAASGMPIVSTRHCDIPEVVKDGETGMLVNERDVAGLVGAISWFAENRDRWEEMAVAGRHHIEAEYNAEHQGIRLGALYFQLIGQ